jgi:ATP-dependent Clp protease protease subunit
MEAVKMKMSKIVWNIKPKNQDEAELYLYEEIGDSWWNDSKTAKQFKQELDALGDVKNLTIYINSPGGAVFDGMAIYNILKRHKAFKTVHVDGVAASIASVIAMAGDKVIVPSNAYFMIHRAWSIYWGNKNDFFKMAEDLEIIDEGIINVYLSRPKIQVNRTKIEEMMDEETWMTGDEAVEYGFADEVEKEKKVAAAVKGDFAIFNGRQFNIKDFNYRNLPKLAEAEEEDPPKDPEPEPPKTEEEPKPDESPANNSRVFEYKSKAVKAALITKRRK